MEYPSAYAKTGGGGIEPLLNYWKNQGANCKLVKSQMINITSNHKKCIAITSRCRQVSSLRSNNLAQILSIITQLIS